MGISSGDGSSVPTASLQDILNNDPYIAKEAKLKPRIRNDLGRYILAMRLNINDLDQQFEFGVYAVRQIIGSGSFHGFQDGLRGRKFNPTEYNGVDYKLGYDKGRKRHQYGRK